MAEAEVGVAAGFVCQADGRVDVRELPVADREIARRAVGPFGPMPQRGLRELDHPQVIVGRPVGLVDQFPRAVEAIGGEKTMCGGHVEGGVCQHRN